MTELICSFDGCDRPMYAKDLCHGHRTQVLRGKPLTPLQPRRKARPDLDCSFDGCMEKRVNFELCVAHYQQQKRGMRLQPLKNAPGASEERFWSRVDVRGADDCWEWSGPKTPFGHGRTSVNSAVGVAHRIAWEFLVGPIPDGMVLDHICNNPPCCNPSHLQPITQQLNSALRAYWPRNTSGYRNVHWENQTESWRAQISFRGKGYNLGRYATPEAAAEAVATKRQELYGSQLRESRDGTR